MPRRVNDVNIHDAVPISAGFYLFPDISLGCSLVVMREWTALIRQFRDFRMWSSSDERMDCTN